MPILIKILENSNTKIETLTLGSNNLTSEEFNSLRISFLKYCNKLKILRLGYQYNLSNVACQQFIEDIPFFINLNKVEVGFVDVRNSVTQQAFKRQKLIRMGVILCSAFEIKRLSRNSSIRKLHPDLTRKLMGFLTY